MSERGYAAHAGISRGAVQKARASGRVIDNASSPERAFAAIEGKVAVG